MSELVTNLSAIAEDDGDRYPAHVKKLAEAAASRIAALEAQLAARTGAVKVQQQVPVTHPVPQPSGTVEAILHHLKIIEDEANRVSDPVTKNNLIYEIERIRFVLSALSPAPEAQQESHEILHVYEGDGGVIIRENGNISAFGAQSDKVTAAFNAASGFTRPSEQAVTGEAMSAAEEIFADYFRRNYPGPGTVISKPDWHSPKIFRAALHALRSVDALKAAMEAKE